MALLKIRLRSLLFFLALISIVCTLLGFAAFSSRRRAEPVPVALPEPKVSVPSRAFSVAFLVEILDPGGAGEIRYTLDGSEPSPDSPIYSKPISIRRTTILAARTFSGGSPPRSSSPAVWRNFVLVDEEVARFHSEIPIIVIETFGREVQRYRYGEDQPTPYVDALFHVIEPGEDGGVSFTAPASFSGRAAVKARGSSTLGREKTSLAVEIRDSAGEDLAKPLLGLPEGSDWVLLGPLEFDRALIRNALLYELARRCGRYAPRTRFVELFLNEDGGPLRGPVPEGNDYYGVYLLIEKIKRGKDRVAVEKLAAADRLPPAVEGGYILKLDRPGPGEMGFRAGRQRFHYVYPKEATITEEQAAWIRWHLEELQAALESSGFDDPETGYARYLDVEAAIDYHILNELAKNPDSYVYSTYLHKPRGGKVVLGPVWDFDRTMGCDNDRRARDPHGWSRNRFRFWYRRLFQDRAFVERYHRRWQELRGGPFQDRRVRELIDAMAESIAQAAERNTARWGRSTGLAKGEWREEIDQLKRWIQARLEWLDLAS